MEEKAQAYAMRAMAFIGGLAALGRLSPAVRPLFASPANAA